jgi:hypothetical protein
MGRFLWQELDEVGDFGRVSVKKRPRLFLLFGLLDERASSARVSHARGDSGRGERLDRSR